VVLPRFHGDIIRYDVRWIAFAAMLTACLPSESASTQNPSSDDPVEYRMAVIDAGPYGSYVRPDSPVVDEYAQALDELESLCTDNTRTEIANQTIAIHKQLTEAGDFEDLLEIMTTVADPETFQQLQATVEASRDGDCTAYLGAYHDLRVGGG
jgi:hypothetical protein